MLCTSPVYCGGLFLKFSAVPADDLRQGGGSKAAWPLFPAQMFSCTSLALAFCFIMPTPRMGRSVTKLAGISGKS